MRIRTTLEASALCAATLLTACRTEQTLVTPHPHLERMVKQEKVLPYENSPVLLHGMAMQVPPDGTEPVDATLGDPLVTTGVDRGHYARRIPIHVDHAMVEDGRKHFDTFCAPCHGILGDGDSLVSRKMNLIKPANLLGSARGYPPGKVFSVIRLGYGLMPNYQNQLSIEDSWEVVAYVRALELSRAVAVDRLPSDLRARLEGP